MIYHVLPGDAQVEEFKKTGLAGEVIVFRDAFVVGPIDADSPDEFWDQRARFVLAEYGDDEIVYHEKVADEISRLSELTVDDEVNLWFEYELFCSVNMWFCLSLLTETGATTFRVEPIGLEEENRWDGFGKFMADDLKASYELRTRFADDDVALGRDLWNAFRAGDNEVIREIAGKESPCFPYLTQVAAAAAERDIVPLEILKEIRAGGVTEFVEIFAEFKKRGGAYGYGDLQVQKLLDQLSS